MRTYTPQWQAAALLVYCHPTSPSHTLSAGDTALRGCFNRHTCLVVYGELKGQGEGARLQGTGGRGWLPLQPLVQITLTHSLLTLWSFALKRILSAGVQRCAHRSRSVSGKQDQRSLEVQAMAAQTTRKGGVPGVKGGREGRGVAPQWARRVFRSQIPDRGGESQSNQRTLPLSWWTLRVWSQRRASSPPLLARPSRARGWAALLSSCREMAAKPTKFVDEPPALVCPACKRVFREPPSSRSSAATRSAAAASRS